MPQVLASQTAVLLSHCSSDEEVRQDALQAFRTAAEYGFNLSNPVFMQALCDDLRELAEAETDAVRKRRLLVAVQIVCEVAAELKRGG